MKYNIYLNFCLTNKMDYEYNIQEITDGTKQEDYSFKIVIVGDCAVGKSNLLSRYIKNEFNSESKSTIGVELSTKIYQINHKIIKLVIWDTAGQERFSSVTSAYYKGAHGAFVVYDITRKTTFDNIDKWISELKNKASPDINMILIGNKSDLFLLRKISTNEAESKANKYNIKFFETSALDSNNIHNAFKEITLQIYSSYINKKSVGGQKIEYNKNNNYTNEGCKC